MYSSLFIRKMRGWRPRDVAKLSERNHKRIFCTKKIIYDKYDMKKLNAGPKWAQPIT